tara:strand:+ start:93 stop:494 length:402 start_codon:yes stop_codon:yes gene_type:complete
MLTKGDMNRIKGTQKELDLTKKIEELQKQKEHLENQCRLAGRTMIELNLKWEFTLEENKKLKKRAQEAEGELTIIKGIGNTSPEMKALQEEVEKLKADLAREKEDRQYDNMVHQKELESLKNPTSHLRKKGLI